MIIPLEVVIVDDRARDGTWCAKYYDGHPKGCPNFPKCIKPRPHFNTFQGYDWFAVVEPFDLKTHAKKIINPTTTIAIIRFPIDEMSDIIIRFSFFLNRFLFRLLFVQITIFVWTRSSNDCKNFTTCITIL